MNRFLRKVFLVTLPFFIGFLSVVITDPFKLVYHYDDYSFRTFPVNRDFISTQYYLDNEAKYNYDAFILGNSRASAFHTEDWEVYFKDTLQPYHFDASSESLYGIERKLHFLDERGVKIKEALIVLDHETLNQVQNRNYFLFTKHYALSGDSRLSFYWTFIKATTHPHFIKFYADFLLDGFLSKLMNSVPRDMTCKEITNDYIFTSNQAALDKNPDSYFERYQGYFQPRSEHHVVHKKVITEAQISLLTNIQKILTQQGTRFKVIIGPNYDQKQLNPEDLSYLQGLFGTLHVHDFSGKNEYTSDPRNYYDGSHYRPYIGREILKKVYASE